MWTLGGGVALIGAFVWAELASRYPHVGGQYVYLQRAYHPVVGFLYGIALLFIINGGSLAAVSILFASYVDRSFVTLGPGGVRAAAAAALVTLTAINAIGVRAGKRTNNLLMAAKVLGMVALLAMAFGRSAPPASRFDVSREAFAPASIHLLLTALVPILFAYGGWQSCANIAAEVKDPARNLPRANVLGVIVVVVLYLSLNLAYLWVMTPAQIAASPALAADMARTAAGEAGARFVALLIVVSSLGFLAVVILTGARLIYAMASDRLFFAPAARLHPRYHTPVFALWFQAAVSLDRRAHDILDPNLARVREWFEGESRLQAAMPEGGNVVFPRLPARVDSDRLTARLMERYSTLVVPGRFFESPRHIRISFGCDANRLARGLENISCALDDLAGG